MPGTGGDPDGPYEACARTLTRRQGNFRSRRGVDQLGPLTLACEVVDWRRFGTAGQFMSFAGLIPSESSSGERVRRGGITKTGNPNARTQLVESAWAYRYPPQISPAIAKRHADLDPEVIAQAWKAQLRCRRTFQRLAERKDSKKLAATAVARELAGFVWAELVARRCCSVERPTATLTGNPGERAPCGPNPRTTAWRFTDPRPRRHSRKTTDPRPPRTAASTAAA